MLQPRVSFVSFYNNLVSRKSAVTAENLKAHENLIQTAMSDLGSHLESIDEKMELMLEGTAGRADSGASELQQLKEERLSTEKCLQICTQLSDHINEIEIIRKDDGSSSGSSDPSTFPERVINEGLQECKNSLDITAAKLARHINDIMDRLMTKSKTIITSEEELAELSRLKDQWETTRQCMDICSKADKHLKENVSNIVNYSTGDAVQFMVSTDGTIINGTNRAIGWRARQVGGHLDNATVQQISRDLATINIRHPVNEAPSSRSNTSPAADDENLSEHPSEFSKRHGRGLRLPTKPTPGVSITPTTLAEYGHRKP